MSENTFRHIYLRKHSPKHYFSEYNRNNHLIIYTHDKFNDVITIKVLKAQKVPKALKFVYLDIKNALNILLMPEKVPFITKVRSYFKSSMYFGINAEYLILVLISIANPP